eukprot:5863848-Prymnesium_polylepis.1
MRTYLVASIHREFSERVPSARRTADVKERHSARSAVDAREGERQWQVERRRRSLVRLELKTGKLQANAAPRAAAAVPHTLVAAPDVPDPGTLRDWALLRAWKELAGPEEVLEALRAQGHMDEEEQ